MRRSSAIDPIFRVKDGLRRIRYGVRRSAAGEVIAPPPLSIPPLPQPVAFIADSMLSVVEAVRDVLAGDHESDDGSLRDPPQISEYVALATKPRENLYAFTPVAYRAIKSFAFRAGAREVLISELALERARRKFAEGLETRRRHGPREAAATLFWDGAALAVAMAAARPIKRLVAEARKGPRARHFADDPNVFVACGIGLSACIAAKRPLVKSAPHAVFITAEAAIDARFAQMAGALAGPDPIGALAGEFSIIISFLGSA